MLHVLSELSEKCVSEVKMALERPMISRFQLGSWEIIMIHEFSRWLALHNQRGGQGM